MLVSVKLWKKLCRLKQDVRCSKQEAQGFVVSKLLQMTMKHLAKEKQIEGKARNQCVHQVRAPLCSTSRNAAFLLLEDNRCPSPNRQIKTRLTKWLRAAKRASTFPCLLCKHSKQCVTVLAAKAGSPQWSEKPPPTPPGRLIHTPSSGAFGGRAFACVDACRGPALCSWASVGVLFPLNSSPVADFNHGFIANTVLTDCIHLRSVVASSDEKHYSGLLSFTAVGNNWQSPRWTSRHDVFAVSEPVARTGASSALSVRDGTR